MGEGVPYLGPTVIKNLACHYCLGHMMWMSVDRLPKKVLFGELSSTRPFLVVE